jgi:hypothetical protein
MNLYSVAMDTLRGFGARRRAAHAVKKRTCIFVLVPFDFSKNGNAKRAEITQDLIKDHSDFERAASYKPHALRALGRGAIRAATKTSTELVVADEPELDFRLMWTWFLPNPLWPPNKVENFFCFGLCGFNPKTRRES